MKKRVLILLFFFAWALTLRCQEKQRAQWKLPPFDSLLRFDIRFAPYAFSSDTPRYKLMISDIPDPMRGIVLGKQMMPLSSPIGYYGLAMHEGIIIHRFELINSRGMETILVASDSTAKVPKLLLRIGQSGEYFRTHDNKRTKLYPDSTEILFRLDRSTANWPKQGLLVTVYTHGEYVTSQTQWKEYYHISTDGSIRKLGDLEYYWAHTQKAPLRSYQNQLYFSDHESGNPFPLVFDEMGRYNFIPKIISDGMKEIGFRWSVRLNSNLWLLRLQLTNDSLPERPVRTDVLFTVDKHFRLIDTLFLPISGPQALVYNASRMPDSLLNIHLSEFLVQGFQSDSVKCTFTINSGSLGMNEDPLGEPFALPDGWWEKWRVNNRGSFIIDSIQVNKVPPPTNVLDPNTGTIFVIPKRKR
jgi:hypothetical protein